MGRRTLLKWLVHLGSATAAAVVAVPALISALAPAWQGARRRGAWRALGPLESFPLRDVRQANVQVGRDDWPAPLQPMAVYVWRPGDAEVVVFSRSCTDLGCPVNYDPGSRVFFCPCHGGIFNQDGARMAGPPNRPLHRYASRVRGGVLEIDLRSVPPTS